MAHENPANELAAFATVLRKTCMSKPLVYLPCLFIYFGFYIAFNTVQVISQQVVGRTDETRAGIQGSSPGLRPKV